MVVGGSAVGSPLPHREVVNNLAKTLKVGGKEEKLFHEQLISGNELLIQVPTSFVIYQHLPTKQLNGLYKGVPKLGPNETCHVLEKQQWRHRKAPLQEETDIAGNSSLISLLSSLCLGIPGEPFPTSIQPYKPHQGTPCVGWREQPGR